jgi:hypothetical protein
MASDGLAASFGNDALRWALLAVVTLTSVLASALFWLAGRSAPREIGCEAPAADRALPSSSAVSS